jgi:hypothetical protein
MTPAQTPKPADVSQAQTPIDPALQTVLSRLEQTLKTHWAKETETFKKEILSSPGQPEQLIFSFLPHQLAKTSIFFPLSDRELKEENRRIHRLEHNTAWGKIIIEGIKLAIFEEDILLALLYLAKDHTQKDGDGRYALKIRMPEVAKILYQNKSYTKTTYQRIDKALAHFGLVRFEIIVNTLQKKERAFEEKKTSINGILSGHTYLPASQELTIYWNDRFFAYFLESMISNINLTLRRQLKKDGSKALLRFLSTHSKPDRMHILTVLNAINYNTEQPMFRLRSHLKAFAAELKQHGVLGPKTKIFNDDTIYFDIQKPKKSLPD